MGRLDFLFFSGCFATAPSCVFCFMPLHCPFQYADPFYRNTSFCRRLQSYVCPPGKRAEALVDHRHGLGIAPGEIVLLPQLWIQMGGVAGENVRLLRRGDQRRLTLCEQIKVPVAQALEYLRVLDRVAGSRRLRKEGQHDHLIETQRGDILAEIEAGCIADAVNAVAEIEDIDIQLQDAVLPELMLQRQGDQKFCRFSPKALCEAQIQVFGELLGDGAAAADKPLFPEIRFPGSADELHIVSGVFIEDAVLLPEDQQNLLRRDLLKGQEVRLRSARLIQAERRPFFQQKKGIARNPGKAREGCREHDADCLFDDQAAIPPRKMYLPVLV